MGTILRIVDRIHKRMVLKGDPESVLVDEICDALFFAADSVSWKISAKNAILRHLENSAEILETYVPATIRVTDSSLTKWLQQRVRGNAAALRQRGRWVCSPQAGTRDLLIEDLATVLRHVSSGQWHYLPYESPQAVNARLLLGEATTYLRLIIRAATPVLLLYVWRATPMAPSDSSFSRLLVAAYTLSAVYLLVGLDPEIVSKIGAASSALRLLGGKSGDD